MFGLIGTKLGMSQLYNAKEELVPVTLVRVDPNYVLGIKTIGTDGYEGIVLASIPLPKEHRKSRSVRAQFTNKSPLPLQKKIVEFRINSKGYKRGDILTLDTIKDYRFIDITGYAKGKGFQGVMKRHGFSGGRATHGSKTHREVGSTGMAATPSRTLKNTKMAGRMPARRVTMMNVMIEKIDSEYNIVALKGGVPGAIGGVVLLRSAVKKTML